MTQPSVVLNKYRILISGRPSRHQFDKIFTANGHILEQDQKFGEGLLLILQQSCSFKGYIFPGDVALGGVLHIVHHLYGDFQVLEPDLCGMLADNVDAFQPGFQVGHVLDAELTILRSIFEDVGVLLELPLVLLYNLRQVPVNAVKCCCVNIGNFLVFFASLDISHEISAHIFQFLRGTSVHVQHLLFDQVVNVSVHVLVKDGGRCFVFGADHVAEEVLFIVPEVVQNFVLLLNDVENGGFQGFEEVTVPGEEFVGLQVLNHRQLRIVQKFGFDILFNVLQKFTDAVLNEAVV